MAWRGVITHLLLALHSELDSTGHPWKIKSYLPAVQEIYQLVS